jgi:hypothetical protein
MPSGEHAHPDLADQIASVHLDLVAQSARWAEAEKVHAELLARVAALEAIAVPPASTPMRPIRFGSVDEARTVLDLPPDATYVTWRPEWTDLESAFAAMAGGDILVLPERAAPYIVDSSKGFRVPTNVARVDGVTAPLARGRGWFSMTRARRGILGLGPGVVVEVGAPGAFTQGPQPNAPRYWYDTTGKASLLTGTQESVIDFGYTAGPCYVGNLTVRGRDLGGVAYTALKHSAALTVERVFFDAAHRGFKAAPNGEAGAVCVNGPLVMRHVEVECRDASGASVGTSPVMLNRAPSSLIEDSYLHHATIGMPTYWECYGAHVWRRVTSEGNSVALNLEAQGRDKSGTWVGFTLTMDDCRLLTPSGSARVMVNMTSPYGSQKLTLTGCEVTGGRVPGLSVQTGTPTKQLDADITAANPALPITFYR